jgi:hypothetical protein
MVVAMEQGPRKTFLTFISIFWQAESPKSFMNQLDQE